MAQLGFSIRNDQVIVRRTLRISGVSMQPEHTQDVEVGYLA